LPGFAMNSARSHLASDTAANAGYQREQTRAMDCHPPDHKVATIAEYAPVSKIVVQSSPRFQNALLTMGAMTDKIG